MLWRKVSLKFSSLPSSSFKGLTYARLFSIRRHLVIQMIVPVLTNPNPHQPPDLHNRYDVHVEVVKFLSTIHCLHLTTNKNGRKKNCISESPFQMLQTIMQWEYRGICGWNCCHKGETHLAVFQGQPFGTDNACCVSPTRQSTQTATF